MNDDDDSSNDMVLVGWSESDLASLGAAADEFIESRSADSNYSAEDREDYKAILTAYQNYLKSARPYWD